MKRLFYFLLTTVIAVSLNSCGEKEKEECEINNVGDIEIVNNTDIDLWFDVTPLGADEENQNRKVVSGGKTSYTMTAGDVEIWVSEVDDNAEYWVIAERKVYQCSSVTYTLESCDYYEDGEVTVYNEANFDVPTRIYVEDLGFYPNQDGYTIPMGESSVFYVPAGTIYFDYHNGSNWVEGQEAHELSVCGTFEFTWSSSKMMNKSSNSVERTFSATSTERGRIHDDNRRRRE